MEFSETGERLVGRPARRHSVLNPQGAVYSAKRPGGRRSDEVRTEFVTFEQVTADLVERCMGPGRQAMADGKVTADDVDEVVTLGAAVQAAVLQGGSGAGRPRGSRRTRRRARSARTPRAAGCPGRYGGRHG